jgi:hypothetical protein
MHHPHERYRRHIAAKAPDGGQHHGKSASTHQTIAGSRLEDQDRMVSKSKCHVSEHPSRLHIIVSLVGRDASNATMVNPHACGALSQIGSVGMPRILPRMLGSRGQLERGTTVSPQGRNQTQQTIGLRRFTPGVVVLTIQMPIRRRCKVPKRSGRVLGLHHIFKLYARRLPTPSCHFI